MLCLFTFLTGNEQSIISFSNPAWFRADERDLCESARGNEPDEVDCDDIVINEDHREWSVPRASTTLPPKVGGPYLVCKHPQSFPRKSDSSDLGFLTEKFNL
jgi:hypothetical protein